MCIDSRGRILNSEASRALSSELSDGAAKVVTLVDLCGHERYFKTTWCDKSNFPSFVAYVRLAHSYGLTGTLPDFACVIVGGNAGLVGLSREHFGLAIALRIPAFFVVSKIDMAPEHVLQATVAELTTTLKKPGVRKRPLLVKTEDDVYVAARSIGADSVTPIFMISAVDGRGLALLRLFLNLLPAREDWHSRESEPAQFLIDEVFSVPGVGTVVAGTLKSGVVTESSKLLLGPDPGDGQFKQAAVKRRDFCCLFCARFAHVSRLAALPQHPLQALPRLQGCRGPDGRAGAEEGEARLRAQGHGAHRASLQPGQHVGVLRGDQHPDPLDHHQPALRGRDPPERAAPERNHHAHGPRASAQRRPGHGALPIQAAAGVRGAGHPVHLSGGENEGRGRRLCAARGRGCGLGPEGRL